MYRPQVNHVDEKVRKNQQSTDILQHLTPSKSSTKTSPIDLIREIGRLRAELSFYRDRFRASTRLRQSLHEEVVIARLEACLMD